MLHKSKSKKINKFKYLLIIPILALFLMSFNTEEVYVEKENTTNNENIEEFIFKPDFNDKQIENFKKTLKNEGYTFKVLKIERDKINTITNLYFEINKDGIKTQYSTSNENNGDISIKYLKEKKTFNINTLHFNNNLKRLSNKEDIIEIKINKNSTVESLEKQKKLFKEKYNKDFIYDISKSNSINGISVFSYGLSSMVEITTVLDPETHYIIKYDKKNDLALFYKLNKQGIPTDGEVFYGSTSFRTQVIFNNYYTQTTLDEMSKLLKNEYDINTKFSNIKYNKENKIIAITINAFSKYHSINHSINSNNPINNFMIAINGKGHNIRILEATETQQEILEQIEQRDNNN